MVAAAIEEGQGAWRSDLSDPVEVDHRPFFQQPHPPGERQRWKVLPATCSFVFMVAPKGALQTNF